MSVSTKAKDMVEDGKKAATREARAKAEDVRDDVTERGEAVSKAAHAAAEELDGAGPVQDFLHQAGDAVDGAARRLQERSIPDLVDDVAGFARRNPLLFLGGAALAGFAAARFLSARSPEVEEYASDEDVWSGHLGDVAEAGEAQ